MSKGPKGEYKPADVIGCAVNFAKIAITGELKEIGLKQPGKQKSGIEGSNARSESLSNERRSEIAKKTKKAADTRWG